MAKSWRVLGLIGALALVPLDSGAQGFAIEKVALDGEAAHRTRGEPPSRAWTYSRST